MPEGKKKEGKMEKDETPPGYRRLKLKEVIQEGDLTLCKSARMSDFDGVLRTACCIGATVQKDDGNYYYRPIPPIPNWMADSRPLLAEIAALSVQRDVLVIALTTALERLQDIAALQLAQSPATIKILEEVLASLEVAK